MTESEKKEQYRVNEAIALSRQIQEQTSIRDAAAKRGECLRAPQTVWRSCHFRAASFLVGSAEPSSDRAPKEEREP